MNVGGKQTLYGLCLPSILLDCHGLAGIIEVEGGNTRKMANKFFGYDEMYYHRVLWRKWISFAMPNGLGLH